jgi:hypothetical protein
MDQAKNLAIFKVYTCAYVCKILWGYVAIYGSDDDTCPESNILTSKTGIFRKYYSIPRLLRMEWKNTQNTTSKAQAHKQ